MDSTAPGRVLEGRPRFWIDLAPLIAAWKLDCKLPVRMEQVDQVVRLYGAMHALEEAATKGGRAYLSGGVVALRFGITDPAAPVRMDLHPQQDDLAAELPRLGDELGMRIELGTPRQHLPVPPNWQSRSPSIQTFEKLDFFEFDRVSQVLQKLNRDSFREAQEMVAGALVEPAEVQAGFEAIESELPSFPGVDPGRLRQQVEQLCSVETNGLAIALGKDELILLAELGAYGADVSPREALEKGFRIFKALRRTIEDTICTSPEIRGLVEDNRGTLELASAVADLVATVSNQLPTATVSALIVKHGLISLCEPYWT